MNNQNVAIKQETHRYSPEELLDLVCYECMSHALCNIPNPSGQLC